MKFTPESLLQIYMDGSFTEEAQAEFDKLVRKDPLFAEKVSQAIAIRVGEAPEPLLTQVESNLDGKMAALWEAHKPSPFGMLFKKIAVGSAMLLGAFGLYFLFHQYGSLLHWSGNSSAVSDQAQPDSTLAPNSTAQSSKTNSNASKTGGIKTAGAVTPRKSSKARSAEKTSKETASPENSKGVAPVQPPVPSQTTNGTGLTGIPSVLPPVTTNNETTGQNTVPNTSSAKALQPSVSDQLPTGLPPLQTAPLTPPGNGSRTEEGDALRVSIETQKTQSVVVTVLDSNGKSIRQLYQGQWNAGVHVVDWDGKDEVGNPVLPGNYTVVVNADGKTMSGVVTVQPNK